MNRTRLLATMAVFVAIGLLGSQFIWFPAGVAKAYPAQHTLNVYWLVYRSKKEGITIQPIPTALTISGTDPTGGAGIQADLQIFQELKNYGMSVITSVVAQNTTGVRDVHHMPVSMIELRSEEHTS